MTMPVHPLRRHRSTLSKNAQAAILGRSFNVINDDDVDGAGAGSNFIPSAPAVR